MKKTTTLGSKIRTTRFNLLDVLFLVVIFSLLSITITIFIFRKALNKNESSNIDKVYNQIVNNYYQEVNKEELANSAIDGMMKYLGEKYSIYMDKDSTEALSEQLDGTYKGIGVIVQMNKEGLTIMDVFKDSPADKGGLNVGDIILQMDEYKVDSSSDINEAVQYIKDHDEIAFLIKRHESEVIINIRSTNVDNPVVSSKLLTSDNNNYGYIYLGSFSSASYKQFRGYLEDLEKSDIKGLIIDLRENRGGYLEQAHQIASMFIKKGKVLYTLKEKNSSKAYLDETDEERTYPIVIITNNNTASSSELLAMALKEDNGALIVGTTTVGKGKVQETASLGSSMVKYTTAMWYSPNRNNIDGVGIKPNYIVELSKKYYNNPTDENDNQLKKALDILIQK